MRFINRLSLQKKLIGIPLASAIIMVFLAIILTRFSQSQHEVLKHVVDDEMRIVEELDTLLSHFATIHANIYELLVSSSNQLDEEAIYEQGKPLIEDLHKLENQIITLHHLPSNKENIKQSLKESFHYYTAMEESKLELHRFITQVLDNYIGVAINAVEMATVDRNLSLQHMARADRFYTKAIREYQSLVAKMRHHAYKELQITLVLSKKQSVWILACSLSALVVMLGLGLTLSQNLSRSIQLIIDTINRLARGEHDQPVATVQNLELEGVGNSLEHFRKSLLELESETNQRKQAEEELRKLFRAVENSHNTIVITDLEGTIEYANPAFTTATGYSIEEVIGKNPRFLKSGLQDESVYSDLWDYLKHGKVWKGELCNKRKDGTLYWESATISPIKDNNGHTTHFVAVKDDITLQKQYKERLHRAKDAAEAASNAKSDFLANMSHEIRTPMNAIIGRTRLALGGKLDPAMKSHLDMISNSADNLLALINDILDFSKIEAGELTIENRPFDLLESIDSCLKTAQVLIDDKDNPLELKSTVEVDVPRAVSGDALRFRQILLNLLSNSVKFTEKGNVHVFVKQLHNDDKSHQLEFTVQDTGVGINPDKREHIFDHFSQEDDSITRKFGGTGLGLTISRQLCQLMGGDIEVLSTPGKGSSFIFSLSLQPCDEEKLTVKVRAADAVQIEIPPLSVLLVEDNETNRTVARMVLEAGKHQITEAHDGLQALDLLSRQDFDVVLMDVQMPVMDGLTSTRIIRMAERGDQIEGVDEKLASKLNSHLSGRHTPIIALTANALVGDRDICLSAGMDDYLAKPFDPDSITTVFGKVVTGSFSS